jgi:SAM-dependent methyltransferase
LPFLSRHFKKVYAVDFAQGMLERAREHARDCGNVHYMQASFADLRILPEPVDVAVAVNSLVLPNPAELEQALREIGRCLKPDGYFLGILPAMDAVHYSTMLLLDRALQSGKPIDAARKNAAHHAEHETYDFAFGQFHFRGLEQHFWQPFEVGYRFRRTGFALKRLKKIHLSWKQFAGGKDLQEYPPPWDWFFLAKRA